MHGTISGSGESKVGELTIIEEQQLTKNLSSDQKTLFTSQLSSVRKDRDIALVLSVLAGTWGVDRFYVGDIGMGLLKLLTVGGCGILWIVDWFLIRGRADDRNRGKAIEIAQVLLSDHSQERDLGLDESRGDPRSEPQNELRDKRREEIQSRTYRGDRDRDDYR